MSVLCGCRQHSTHNKCITGYTVDCSVKQSLSRQCREALQNTWSPMIFRNNLTKTDQLSSIFGEDNLYSFANWLNGQKVLIPPAQLAPLNSSTIADSVRAEHVQLWNSCIRKHLALCLYYVLTEEPLYAQKYKHNSKLTDLGQDVHDHAPRQCDIQWSSHKTTLCQLLLTW